MLITAADSQFPSPPLSSTSLALCPGRPTRTDCSTSTSLPPGLQSTSRKSQGEMRRRSWHFNAGSLLVLEQCLCRYLCPSITLAPMTLLMAPYLLGSSHNLSSPHSPSGLGDNGFLLLLIPGHLTITCQFPQPCPYLCERPHR